MITWAVVACLAGCANDPSDDAMEPELFPSSFSEVVADENLDVVEGVEVCVYERDDIPCATTDAGGRYELRLPDDEDLVLRYAKEGFVPKLRMVHTRERYFGFWFFQHTAFYAEQEELAGVNWQDGTAMVFAQLAGRGADARVMIEPPLGDGPFYLDEDMWVDRALMATGESGLGGYVNVPPGRYLAAASSNVRGVYCSTDTWPVMAGYGGEVIAVAGHVTLIDLSCE